MFALFTAGAVFNLNEDKFSGDGVDRNSAVIGGMFSFKYTRILSCCFCRYNWKMHRLMYIKRGDV